MLTELGRGNLSIGREIGGFVPTDALDRLLEHARQLGIAACKSEILNVRELGFARLRAAGRASA
ncbi:hypothetical protein [Bosea sp. ANAM02]|uniref:hypothetical protein n=1 Tax=Bosea sp. ANAM02 TaxID=2020412 RepID=UPI00140F34EC|nr:hypothetical protein [Bosea sp. ANAM02]BCB21165.1 hypothetical protein OCUBac02_40590 [Bosea sp. ANAM02]